MKSTTTVLFFVAFLPYLIEGHGRMLLPPSRASMWREGFNNPPNYNDNELNCGGFGNQWNVQGGKCGVCGDPYQDSTPRAHEAGGEFANGVIAATYREGDIITIELDITANHKGWSEFRLCVQNDIDTPITQECLDQVPLELADGSGTQWPMPPENKRHQVELNLPQGVTCDQCVLQWKWNCGNSWGTGTDGVSCVGCGPQEQFYACADVAIQGNGDGNSQGNTGNSDAAAALLIKGQRGHLAREDFN